MDTYQKQSFVDATIDRARKTGTDGHFGKKQDMEYEYWLQQLFRYGIGPKRRQYLREAFGNGEGIFLQSREALEQVKGISKEQAQQIVKSKEGWDMQSYERLEKAGIHMVTCRMEAFPRRLRDIPDAPDALFFKGSLPKDDQPSVAIVGARNCTNYGKETAICFAQALSLAGVQVISGLAYGIDGHAQQGVLEVGGATFGVLGCGVDICYPRTHIGMYMNIQRKGGILSEYPPETPPLARQFPLRNRIISGLADVVLVIEAKEKSGSLITVEYALEQGRDVYAVPGRLGDDNSRGCNRLILQGAGLAFSPEELLKQMRFCGENPMAFSKDINFSLAREEKLVYSCLDLHPKHLDLIVKEVQLPVSQVFSVLLSLQLKGYITETDRAYYCKNPRFAFAE